MYHRWNENRFHMSRQQEDLCQRMSQGIRRLWSGTERIQWNTLRQRSRWIQTSSDANTERSVSTFAMTKYSTHQILKWSNITFRISSSQHLCSELELPQRYNGLWVCIKQSHYVPLPHGRSCPHSVVESAVIKDKAFVIFFDSSDRFAINSDI